MTSNLVVGWTEVTVGVTLLQNGIGDSDDQQYTCCAPVCHLLAYLIITNYLIDRRRRANSSLAVSRVFFGAAETIEKSVSREDPTVFVAFVVRLSVSL